MAIDVTCPTCNRQFKAPDHAAGKKARCPSCGGVIEIAPTPTPAPAMAVQNDAPTFASPAPVEPDEDYDLGPAPPDAPAVNVERKPCPMCGEKISVDAVKCRYCGEVFDRALAGVLGGTADMRDPGWRKVRSALTLIFRSMIAIIVACVIIAIGAIVEGADPGRRGGPSSPITIVCLIIGGFTFLGAGIAMLVGHAMCANVPKVTGARGCAIGAIVCFVANIFLAMATAGAAAGDPGARGSNPIGSFLNLVGWVLFILFIRRTAAYLGDPRLAASAARFLIFGVIVFVGAIAGVIAAVITEAIPAIAIVGLVMLVALLVATIWYMRLIVGLRKAIDQNLQKTRSSYASPLGIS